jgi:hypothetical protein
MTPAAPPSNTIVAAYGSGDGMRTNGGSAIAE